jgi:hypothetical protein
MKFWRKLLPPYPKDVECRFPQKAGKYWCVNPSDHTLLICPENLEPHVTVQFHNMVKIKILRICPKAKIAKFSFVRDVSIIY